MRFVYNCAFRRFPCVYYIKIQKGGATRVEKDFIRASDVAKILGCSKSTAYRLMRRIRAELDAKNLITLPGVVPRHYFLERMGVK